MSLTIRGPLVNQLCHLTVITQLSVTKLIFFLSDVRLCYGSYIWLNLLRRGYRKCILTIWMENSEKSLAKAQQSQLYCLQQTIACSRLSDSGEDAKEKGAFSIQRTRPSRSLEQATGFHVVDSGQPRGISRVLGKTLFQILWNQTTKVRDWGFLSSFFILRSVIFFLFTIGRFEINSVQGMTIHFGYYEPIICL